ncbi:cytochrome P450 [Streptomyces sp. 8L]|uniref:cytochrome P450 n=1 Tax=Streptomyces sp. 8L TaxID=2877242 RepID=UPI001CD6DE11|nr:cytochrome P450 [Streptomyces sp. 8L]MCA1221054.1 cytochrome P450 [Streptomyces sp. 8L]
MVTRKTALASLAGALTLSAPLWLPRSVVALRMKVFAAVNGDDALTFPNETVGPDSFQRIYGHPAAGGRSKGAALSDLFWYWLSPGADVHQEHLEAGERYDQVARTTREILAGPSAELYDAATRCTARVLAEAARGRVTLVRLRDVMMPVWAEFFYTLVFEEPCPPEARRLITDNARDVVDALKCTRPRHMRRRARLTRYLRQRVAAGDVPHELPALLSERDRVYYLQGTFFNTAVVQMSEAMAHLLLVLAQHRDIRERLTAAPDDDRLLANVMDETFRLYPLFGVAHRITTGDIEPGDGTTIPAGSVLCFSYPDYHATGHTDPGAFDPDRWNTLSPKDAHHIPFGVAANRPCPAWRLSPLLMRAATREVLRRYTLESGVSHTRSIPHRAPCLLIARDRPLSPRAALAARAALRLRDAFEDAGRGTLQLGFGTWMVLDARRKRQAAAYFETHDTQGRPRTAPDVPDGTESRCPYAAARRP